METPQKKLIEKKAGSLEESGRHHGYDVGEGGNVLEQQRKEKVRKNFVYIMYMLLHTNGATFYKNSLKISVLSTPYFPIVPYAYYNHFFYHTLSHFCFKFQ